MTDAVQTDDPGPLFAPPDRIATLDILRGVAVMGILAMNIVAFAMPFQAYMNPLAYGLESQADLASWLVSFILIDGKMRGFFSFMFGASTLLVIESAQASGGSPARAHYARMGWLLVFGLLHFYLIWFGDILAAYALCGLILYAFRNLSVRALVIWGIVLVILQMLLMGFASFGIAMLAAAAAMPDASAETLRSWHDLQRDFGGTEEAIATSLALYQGGYAGIVTERLTNMAATPFVNTLFFGLETLGYMVLGMAAFKSGFFRGAWDETRYRKWAVTGFAIGLPVYALFAWALLSDGFSVPMVFAISMTATGLVRPLMVMALAALVILLTRKGGALTDRIAAAGRAAFTNYLGTSILMTTLFYGYGFGLFGHLSRIELWIPVIAVWALMLLWSKPWLDRFRYGPFEWLWRSLARWQLQPMRKAQ
ncbi:MAG: DUF418 domain-containing protein [Sphingomonas sp.]|nr:DUF418 domain-containing protein [Sphingomonas sp.]